MNASTKEKVESDIAEWNYLSLLPANWYGFSFKKEMSVVDDQYDLFSYTNDNEHRQIVVYYHEETKEYKLRVRIGLTEFCRIECIASELGVFEQLLKNRLEWILADLADFNPQSLGMMMADKKITEWNYEKCLPAAYNGFVLFIKPSEPVKITNGSYIIIDYEDFSCESNFIIFYNVFRDEFFGEARIRNIPNVNYDFDTVALDQLEIKLQQFLLFRLDEIHERAMLEGEEE